MPLRHQWMLEFLLRQPIDDDTVILRLIPSLTTTTTDSRLLTTLLLRRLSSIIQNDGKLVTILQTLEMVANLGQFKSDKVLNLLEEANSAVGVDFAAMIMDENPEDFNTIDRIWRAQNEVHSNLSWWKNLRTEVEVVNAMSDASVAVYLSTKDTRKIALDAVQEFVKEAFEEMGPPFLELVAERMCKAEGVEENGAVMGDQDGVGPFNGSGDPLDDNNTNVPENVPSKMDVCNIVSDEAQGIEENGAVTGHQAAVGPFNDSGDLLDDNNTNVPENVPNKMDVCEPCVTTERNSMPTLGSSKTTEKGKEKCQEMGPSTLKPTPEKVNENSIEAQFPANALVDNQECYVDAMDENLEGNDGNISGDRFRESDISSSTDSSGSSRKRSKSAQTPEIQKVMEALKSSVLDLKAVVNDPLPDALRMAANVSANASQERVNNGQQPEDQNEAGVNARDHSVQKECVHVQAKEGNTGCSAADARPSLMRRNGTACTFEWDEVESSAGSQNRPRLPPYQRRIVTPLREATGATNVAGRRRVKRWSALEEQVLRDAVKEFGRGKWALMLDTYGEIFEERTAVDLKDKWRNMTRYG